MDKSLKSFIQFYYRRYRNFILYGIIGGISASLDFGIYTLLCKLGLNYQIANLISIHCGIFCSFILNRTYNFKTKDRTLLRFRSFYIIGMTGWILSVVILYVMIDIKEWNAIYAKLLVVVVVAISQFLLNKFITFRKSKS
ncbi:MAG: GtrA family protein [Bacteroidales bacterium]|jgi:putative flippase GtrA|nr:GtrA family protein [Bacteroidales bacterium]